MSGAEQRAFTTFTQNIDVVFQNQLIFDFPGSREGLYDFAPLSNADGQMGVYWASRLIQGHQKIGRQVIIEVGHHGKFSPIETALAFPNTTVIGVEPATMEWNEKMINTPDKDWRGSLVALFQFTIDKLNNHGLEVDRVQDVAPDPWSERNILEATWSLVRPGGQIVMAIDPSLAEVYYKSRDEQKPEIIAEQFVLQHSNFEAHVEHLTIEQIKEKYGFSDSKYLKHEGLPIIPVIVATRKL